MKIKIFISFSTEDIGFIDKLRQQMSKEVPEIKPMIVEYQKEGGKEFQDKVIDCLDNCNWFFVLLTNNSIKNQWVNQEIGYAIALKRRGKIEEFIPVVEREVINKKRQLIEIKGFIHKEMESAIYLEDDVKSSINNILDYLRSALEKTKAPDVKKLEEVADVLDRDGYFWEASIKLQEAAGLYIKRQKIKEAIDKLSKSAQILEKGGWYWEASKNKMEIADIYVQNNMVKEAIKRIEEASDLLYKTKRYYWEAALGYEKGADIAAEKELYKKAINLYKKAYEAFEIEDNEFEANRCKKKIKDINKENLN